MKTEMEKCLAGEWYDCHNQVFLDLKTRTHKLLMKYNSLPYEDKEEKHSLLKKMLGSIGMKVSVANPFICDYGCNIHFSYLQPIITQYFIDNKSEIWLLFLIAHSKR